ncbi:membrane fusion protein [Stenotrophomonas rhizophila]|uniref:Membrane fusion protein n=1 Tax=Stenotrophomonas rhizophila TaxID=216778 RepID=A0A498CEW6_9GAMM|nr:HlyD family efflux transporter periplasmic adaptor subunit [Stenotrophomonas rhizophila]RLK56366.1 membrane fusion protein [Stenotrophomonas rhizophila]
MEPASKDETADAIPLFRNEAIEATTQRFGSPVQAPGVGMWLATGFVVALLGLAALFLVTTSFPRKETVAGALVPSRGLLPIISQRSGIVSNVHVEEGAKIRQGDPIVTVSVDSVSDTGESTGATLSGMAERLTQASVDRERATEASLESQGAGIRERMLGTTRQLAVLRDNVTLYKQQQTIAEKTVHDLGRLRADQLVSELQYRDAEVRVLNVRQSVAEVQTRIAQLEQEHEQMRHELGRLKAESDANRATSLSDLLGAREKAINYKLGTQFNLVAQSAGQVTWLQAKPGATVTAGRTLGVMMPEGSQLFAELWVPSSAIAFLDVGTEVRLMYDAFPYQKFGVGHARIVKIARSPTSPEDLPADLQAVESQYRLLAALDDQQMQAYGKALALAPGMRLKADLVLEKRSLLDWLLEPLLAAKRRQE